MCVWWSRYARLVGASFGVVSDCFLVTRWCHNPNGLATVASIHCFHKRSGRTCFRSVQPWFGSMARSIGLCYRRTWACLRFSIGDLLASVRWYLLDEGSPADEPAYERLDGGCFLYLRSSRWRLGPDLAPGCLTAWLWSSSHPPMDVTQVPSWRVQCGNVVVEDGSVRIVRGDVSVMAAPSLLFPVVVQTP